MPFKNFRSVLHGYIAQPENYANVLTYDSEFTLIVDKYPKSLVHLLVLPRDPVKTTQSPLLVFNHKRDPDKAFQKLLLQFVDKIKPVVFQQLLEKVPHLDLESLDFDKYFKVGFHAVPSLSNLHVHIISRDNVSPKMKTRSHYNSFNSPFLLQLKDLIQNDDLNLKDPDSDEFLKIAQHMASSMTHGLKCWRCGDDFNEMKEFKSHLLSESNDFYSQDCRKD